MNKAMKLISLAPTQTEIIAALGMTESLAGVTEDCNFPEQVKKIRRFGTWYSPDIKAIREAGPDIVFTFGSHQEEIGTALRDAGIQVYHSEPPTIAASLRSIREIADLIGRKDECSLLIASLEERLRQIRENIQNALPGRRPAVFRVMTWNPLVTPGPGAFQHDVIEFAGGSNIGSDGPAPYFVCDPERIRAQNPDIIFFCEPKIRDYLKEDIEWRSVNAVREGRVFVYDCGLTCRSGPRIVDMAEELSRAVLGWSERQGA
jgi:iron complex transport system substrate-binding protein